MKIIWDRWLDRNLNMAQTGTKWVLLTRICHVANFDPKLRYNGLERRWS